MIILNYYFISNIRCDAPNTVINIAYLHDYECLALDVLFTYLYNQSSDITVNDSVSTKTVADIYDSLSINDIVNLKLHLPPFTSTLYLDDIVCKPTEFTLASIILLEHALYPSVYNNSESALDIYELTNIRLTSQLEDQYDANDGASELNPADTTSNLLIQQVIISVEKPVIVDTLSLGQIYYTAFTRTLASILNIDSILTQGRICDSVVEELTCYSSLQALASSLNKLLSKLELEAKQYDILKLTYSIGSGLGINTIILPYQTGSCSSLISIDSRLATLTLSTTSNQLGIIDALLNIVVSKLMSYCHIEHSTWAILKTLASSRLLVDDNILLTLYATDLRIDVLDFDFIIIPSYSVAHDITEPVDENIYLMLNLASPNSMSFISLPSISHGGDTFIALSDGIYKLSNEAVKGLIVIDLGYNTTDKIKRIDKIKLNTTPLLVKLYTDSSTYTLSNSLNIQVPKGIRSHRYLLEIRSDKPIENVDVGVIEEARWK